MTPNNLVAVFTKYVSQGRTLELFPYGRNSSRVRPGFQTLDSRPVADSRWSNLAVERFGTVGR